ncbi:MAG: TonB-dependent receptor plug domain-containing protein [Flavobacteriaceae bacterium]|nr:TonB-dependent receptor plug domain-containing protein [Flavobacteriaceae bacterium]
MKKLYISIFTFFLVFTSNVIAQEVKLTIAVKDENNKPIPGAIILIDNVKQKRVSNTAGFFKIKLDKAPKEISAFSPVVGIKTVKYTGENNIVINIIKNKEEIISNTKFAKANTGRTLFRSIYDYIRGNIPGVNVSHDNTITIRGVNSLNGNTTPLFVLNGVQVDQETFSNIVPTTIMSLKVLKGPDTAAYGIRGANGVIEVKTNIN